MIKHLKICILVDDKSTSGDLNSEHGFSLWIEADDHTILFDAGQSDMLIRNAEILNIDLRNTDTLVLSHGHYDHTGGVATLLKFKPEISVYCHPGIFTLRYSRQPDGSMKQIGINKQASAALHQIMDSIHWTSGPTFISEDIGITGSIPRWTNYENTGGAFYLDPEATKQDPIDDDLAMWFRTQNGLLIVSGCCHSGLVNTTEYIIKLTAATPIHTLIGGFHLLHASEQRIIKTCNYLQSLGIKNMTACHCTGGNAVKSIMTCFDGKIKTGGSGEYYRYDN